MVSRYEPKTDAQWRADLGEARYRVLRKKGTERPFSGLYWDSKTPGTYVCAGCAQPLFSSADKYDSGSGWPSYHKPIDEQVVALRIDDSHGTHRLEVVCRQCEGHLGHVFDDGPSPTGTRYCINSLSLELVTD